MLSLYDSLHAPGVEHVQLYRDDENPHRFYMVPTTPSIGRDEDGNPLATFILYARDVDRLAPEDLEVQRGYLSLSTQVAVSPEDQEKIRTFLAGKLAAEQGRFFLRRPITSPTPELSYPPEFIEGTVDLSILTPDMVPFTAGSTESSLSGTNLASFAASLNQDGAELVRQVLQRGDLPAIVNYHLKFLGRIPAIKIRIHGDRSAFFSELVTRYRSVTTTTERVDFWFWSREVRKTMTTEITTLSQFRNTFQSLTIDIDDRDFRDSEDGAETTKKLEELAFSILSSHVMPSFFESLPALSEEQRSSFESISQHVSGTLDITLSRSAVVPVDRNPNAGLSKLLTPEEAEAATSYIDLGNPFFSELQVTINPNVNFVVDPIFALKVFIDYDHMDEIRGVRVKKAKEYLFKSADDVVRFRQIMAKGSDGAPLDSYRWRSELVYKDTGETVNVPASGWIESRERQLVISYRRLGFVKVGLVMSAMPEHVKSVLVAMRYPGSDAPSAQQTVELTADRPTGSFFTYTGHEGDPEPYTYQITYVLDDGQRMDLPEASAQSETLTITNPFERTLQTRFVAQADFSVVDKILVTARYRDADHDFSEDHHAELVANGESSVWSMDVRNPEKLTFEYSLMILFRNGAREDQPPKTRLLGETVPVGVGAVDALEVHVFPLVDFARYKLVILSLEYADNGVSEQKTMAFRAEDAADQTWKVLLRDGATREYRYRLRYLGADPVDNRETEWQASSESVLVVQ